MANRIHHNGIGVNASSFRETSSRTEFATTNVTLVNNTITENTQQGVDLDSTATASFQATLINNTICRNTGEGLRHDDLSTTSDLQMKNNLIANNNGGGIVSTVAGWNPANATPDGILISNNDVFGNSGGNWINYPGSYGNLTKTNSNGTPSDIYFNLSIDPNFKPDGVHLNITSPLVAAGVIDSNATTDFERDRRFSAPDIGADEVPHIRLIFETSPGSNDVSLAPIHEVAVREGAPSGILRARIERSTADQSLPVPITISNPAPNQISIPAAVTIPSGSADVIVDVNVLDNGEVGPNPSLTVNSSAPDHRNVNDHSRVVLSDNELLLPSATSPTEFRVNQQNLTNIDRAPDVAMLPNGGFIAVWHSYVDGTSATIVAQKFDSNNQPTGNQIEVATLTNPAQFYRPQIGADANGNFVVTWNNYSSTTSMDIFAQRFTSEGDPIGDVIPVNSTTSGSQSPGDIAVSTDGRFTIAWLSIPTSGTPQIIAQRFTTSGVPDGSEFSMSTVVNGSAPSVAHDSQGNVAIVWASNSLSVYPTVSSRRYDASSNTWSNVFEIYRATQHLGTDTLSNAKVVIDSQGRTIVAWLQKAS
ncbi:MAG: hypothetical protein FJ267_09120, partial [Planctomycetes bacterium]|nr:hypothetical protein [Planctomycetota bacterium]